MSEYQPIETLPTDGRIVVGWDGERESLIITGNVLDEYYRKYGDKRDFLTIGWRPWDGK